MAAIATLQYNDSLETIRDEIVYTVARLAKNKHTKKEFAKWGAPYLKKWETVSLGQRQAWDAEVIAQAGCDEADDDIDETTGLVDREIKHLDGKDKKRHAHYFKKAPARLIAMAPESQLLEQKEWPKSLQGEPEQSLKELGARIKGDIEAGNAAVGERSAARTATADHRRREINAFIDEVNSARRMLHGTLETLAEQKKLPKEFPERFFRKATVKKKAASASKAAAGGDTSGK
jgi:hypothetical protein